MSKSVKMEGSTAQLLKSKSKNTGEFMKSILQVNDSSNSANEGKINLIKSLHQLKIDFRLLVQFKAQILENIQNGNKTSVEEFHKIKNQIFKEDSGFFQIEKEFLQEVQDSVDGTTIDLIKFSQIVDLYNYLPVKVNRDKN